MREGRVAAGNDACACMGCGGEGNVCARGEAWPAAAPLTPGCPDCRGHPAPGYLAALHLYLGALASGGRSAAQCVGCAPRRLAHLSPRHVRSQGGAVAHLFLPSSLPFSLSSLVFCLNSPVFILCSRIVASHLSVVSVCYGPRVGVRACVVSVGRRKGSECIILTTEGGGGGGHTQAGVGGVVVSTMRRSPSPPFLSFMRRQLPCRPALTPPPPPPPPCTKVEQPYRALVSVCSPPSLCVSWWCVS